MKRVVAISASDTSFTLSQKHSSLIFSVIGIGTHRKPYVLSGNTKDMMEWTRKKKATDLGLSFARTFSKVFEETLQKINFQSGKQEPPKSTGEFPTYIGLESFEQRFHKGCFRLASALYPFWKSRHNFYSCDTCISESALSFFMD